jgi:hypothetical protein
MDNVLLRPEQVCHTCNLSYKVITEVNEWFRNNMLFLNLNKTTYMQFRTKNTQKLDLNITITNNQFTNGTNTKFLGLNIDENLSWKYHIDQYY